MKRFLLAASVLLALLAPLTATYCAVNTPHVVISGEIWLLDADGNKLFIIPDTYYAKINNLDDSFYYVSFNGVNGKINKNLVSTTGYHTVAAGTSREISVNALYADFESVKLRVKPDGNSDVSAVVATNENFTFIGVYPASDTVWYYVRYKEYYGYIKRDFTTLSEAVFEPFVPEPAPDEPAVADPSDNKEDDGLNGINGKELRIILIVGLSIPAILIIFLLFRPIKSRKYYEE